MLRYYVRLALLSLRATPVITALMIGAVALGIGVFMTTLTVYYLMSANPIAWKGDRLYAVQLDGWDPVEPFYDEEPERSPPELTYRDAMALRESDIPTRDAAMYKVSFALQPERAELKPFQVDARVTDGDFFGLFDLRFVHGGPWSDEADDNGELMVVLSESMNEELFGGENSVGRTVTMDDRAFTVAGITEDWNPVPKFYDVNNGAFDESEQVFVPLGVGRELEMFSSGNTNCWKDEELKDFQDLTGSECIWWQYWVELESAEQRDRYQSFLDGYVTSQKALGRFERPLNNWLTPVDEWLDLRGVVQDDNKVLVGLSFLFLGVCLFNTVGLLLAKLFGKAAQIGLRRALGAKRNSVFRQQLVEVGTIGVAGGILGLGLAWLSLKGVRALYEGYDDLVELDLTLAAIAIVSAVVATVLAGLYPAWRVCRVPPAAYLRLQ
ncbi:MAG: ABC transporter permease [Gammaproteobacteria bacterium]